MSPALGRACRAAQLLATQIRLSPIAVSYAVAIPVGVFLVLLWAVSAPIVGRLVVRPIVILSAVAVVLLVPLSAEVTGVPGVLEAIAAVCASMIAATILTDTSQDARPRKSDPVDLMIEFEARAPRREADVVTVPRGG
jgi:hypothetical protein